MLPEQMNWSCMQIPSAKPCYANKLYHQKRALTACRCERSFEAVLFNAFSSYTIAYNKRPSLVMAVQTCSLFAKAESLKYPSPLAPNPAPGVPTIPAVVRRSAKNSHDVICSKHLSQI